MMREIRDNILHFSAVIRRFGVNFFFLFKHERFSFSFYSLLSSIWKNKTLLIFLNTKSKLHPEKSNPVDVDRLQMRM